MTFVLGQSAARSCPVKTFNSFDPTQATAPERPARPEALVQWETAIVDQVAQLEGAVDLRELADEAPERQEQAAVAAMRRRAPIIVAPLLPRDLDGHRAGRAGILVYDEGYLPVIVKWHQVLEKAPAKSAPQLISQLAAPTTRITITERRIRLKSESDAIELGHLWRMLEACGRASTRGPLGGVVGTDSHPDLAGPFLTWFDLTKKTYRTFSRTAVARHRMRSGLERHDHEHGFRVMVARAAQQRQSNPGLESPVRPVKVPECATCRWWEVCRPQLVERDLSISIDKSPLDVREITTLRRLGIETTDDLAASDLESLLPWVISETSNPSRAEERLRKAFHRSQLIAHGIELERTTHEPIDLVDHDVEIDFDIETSSDDRVYLWGFLVHDRRSGEQPYYFPIERFDDLSAPAEQALARKAMTWLLDVTAGRDAAVYHYSDYELVQTRRLADCGDPRIVEGYRRLQELSVDLYATVRQHFFGTHGLGLKNVARVGPGFDWRDEDPGGLNSMSWFSDAVHLADDTARAAARQRVLNYNEDDVRATHVLRAWLRTDPADTTTGS